MRIWVAGGAGFIGSHLCEELLARGDEVRCIDNLSSGSLQNLEACRKNPRFQVVERDICNGPWPVPMNTRRPDVIYHLASLASPVDYLRDPVATILANTEGTRNVLEFARTAGSRVVYVSTSEIYGDPKQTPQVEGLSGELDPESPRAPYYASKGVGEALSYAYRKLGVEVAVARVFNTYGPRMRIDDGRCVPTFIAQALRNEPLPVHGNGSQTRSLCFVDDTVEALMLLGKTTAGPVNIGNDLEISIFALARLIVTLTGSESKVEYTSRISDDPNRRCPDLTKAAKVLGWCPKVPLKEGLLRTIESFYGKVAAA